MNSILNSIPEPFVV